MNLFNLQKEATAYGGSSLLCYFFPLPFLFIFIFPFNNFAQPGIKAGITLSSFYYPGDPPEPYLDYDVDLRPYLGYEMKIVQTGDQKPLIGPFVGVFYAFKIASRIRLQPELAYTQKGVQFKYSNYEEMDCKVIIHSIELPVSIVWQMVQRKHASSELYTGGYGSWNVAAKKKMTVNNGSTETKSVETVKALEAGMHLGVNYKRRVGENFVQFDLRFFLGLSDLFNTQDSWTKIYIKQHNVKTTGLNLTLGYVF